MRKLIIIFLLALCFAAQAFVSTSDIAYLNYQDLSFNVGGSEVHHGDRAGDVWNAYSDLAGISTQGSSTQTQWNNANNQSATVQQGTNTLAKINNNDLKARQLNRNEASLLDQANINSKTHLSAEQKNQALADLNALACAAVQCAAGVSTNDPLYEQVSQLQAQGEALKNQGEDIISTLNVYGVNAKAADNDFVYSRLDQMDDLITSNEQTVARTGQVTQGISGAAEAAGGVALSGTGLGAVIGVPLAGLGAYDMADASDKLGTPHSYQSGQNVLNSFSLDTHGGDISPTKDAAIDLGINAALTVGAAKVAKHADDIADSVKGVFKKKEASISPSKEHGVTKDKFDSYAIEGQQRQQQMLDDNAGYNVSRVHTEKYPEMGNPTPPKNDGNLYPEGGQTFLTDRQAFEKNIGNLPESGGTVKVTRDQADNLASELGMDIREIGTGSTVRKVENIRDLNPTSPIKVDDELFRGAGQHLPKGSPELNVSPAQLKSNNPNVTKEWKLEVIE